MKNLNLNDIYLPYLALKSKSVYQLNQMKNYAIPFFVWCFFHLNQAALSKDDNISPQQSDEHELATKSVVKFYEYLISGDIPLEFLPKDDFIIIELKKRAKKESYKDGRELLRDFLVRNRKLFLPVDAEKDSPVLFLTTPSKPTRWTFNVQTGEYRSTGNMTQNYVIASFLTSPDPLPVALPIKFEDGTPVILFSRIEVKAFKSLLLEEAIKETEEKGK